jgi:hypothetical protein
MNVCKFADENRLRREKDDDGLWIIPCRFGKIGSWSRTRLYWCLTYSYKGRPPSAKRKLDAIRAGLTPEIEGDEEALFVFDPAGSWPLVAKFALPKRLPGPAHHSEAAREAMIQRIQPHKFRKGSNRQQLKESPGKA